MTPTAPRTPLSALALDAPAEPRQAWEHLLAYGYAPGNYLVTCHQCKQVSGPLDKRAITCRPCAEQKHAARLGDAAVQSEPSLSAT